MASLTSLFNQEKRAQKVRALARYYNIDSILGNDWAIFYIILGSRKTGKSYSVTDFLCREKKHKGDNVKNYWMRISETSTKAMLANKCKGLVDPDLVRKYNLDLTHKDMYVYDHGKEFMTVCPLSQFGKLKGVGFYDKDYTGDYNIVLDELMLEQGEKRTSFDILYNFIGMCENLVRTTKTHIRVFLLGNTLEESSSILKAFNFIPHKFGRFYLHRPDNPKKDKRAVIDNLEPTEEYMKDREGSIASILGGDDMSNFTNAMTRDLELLYRGRVIHPTAIIKFGKRESDWYTLWDGKIIKKYNKEKLSEGCDIAMKPYLATYYSRERVLNVMDMYDARVLKFDTLITQAYFEGELQKLRKQ